MTFVDFQVVDEQNNPVVGLELIVYGDVLPKKGRTNQEGYTRRLLLRWGHTYSVVLEGYAGFTFEPAHALLEHDVIVITSGVTTEQVMAPKGRTM